MPRPKSDGETRTKVIKVRYTPTEAKELKESADAVGLVISRFIREKSLGVRHKAKPGIANAELIRQLAGIGNNLNQLTKLSHKVGHADPKELKKVLKQIMEAIKKI